jgi:hypothetical protein
MTDDTDLFDLDAEDDVTQGGSDLTEPDAPKVDPKELEDLRTYKAETETAKREEAIAAAFSEAGLSTKAAKLYAALNPEGEATAESVSAFASEYGIGPEAVKPTGFTPTVIPGGRTPAAKTYTRKEMEDIARVNPARARALADSGRVKWNNEGIGK